jgi:hypothetical protein
MTTPTPAAAWYAITKSQFGDPKGGSMVMAAREIADQAVDAVRAHGSAVADHDTTWSRIAAAAYHELRGYDTAMYPATHPALTPPTCALERAEIRSRLNSPSHPGARRSVAQRPRLDDSWRADGNDIAARLSRLVGDAQEAGVFGVAGHEIRLWQVADHDLYDDGYLITIQTPNGPHLAHGNLNPQELFGRAGRHGDDAAV